MPRNTIVLKSKRQKRYEYYLHQIQKHCIWHEKEYRNLTWPSEYDRYKLDNLKAN